MSSGFGKIVEAKRGLAGVCEIWFQRVHLEKEGACSWFEFGFQ
jgi:hypothetical protein